MTFLSQQSAEHGVPRDYPHREALLAATFKLFSAGALSVDVLYVGSRLTLEALFPQPKPGA